LDKIVTSWGYNLVSNLIVLFTFINCIAVIVTDNPVLKVFDDILIWVFVVDMIIRILGVGPETFFEDKWNYLDFIIVLVIVVVYIIPTDKLPLQSQILLKMTRAFRITSLIKLIKKKKNN
jgi:voltage-gated sodium channel